MLIDFEHSLLDWLGGKRGLGDACVATVPRKKISKFTLVI